MSEIKQRVTNDDARHRIYDIDIRAEKRLLSVNEAVIHRLCSDLLDARALIEKQKEAIKEMRMFIDSIQLDGCMAEIKRDEILDRTKDYAE